MATNDQRLMRLFHGALDVPPAERDAWLDEHCDDPKLRRELDELLADTSECAVEPPDGALESAATAFRTLAERSWLQPLAPGQRIADFVIEEVIASGGMGTVYRAIQDDPSRPVALKVLSATIPGGELERRFRHEASILARLRHPAIAQVHACGTFVGEGANIPWLALEFVEDASWITTYCRQHELDTARRLELFRSVCEAVHYGHCKGVIHRDLKPANLLVDGQGKIKVIDFGVAKILDSDATEAALTMAGHLVGTKGYMSPEQAAGESGAIDTRSDVYALGVVLFELLTGRLPHDVSKLSLVAAARIVTEAPPDAAALRRLPRDLRLIVTTALRKAPDQRYQSAAAVASDVARYLASEPIEARAPSPGYVLRRFVRRNPLLSATASALVLALALGITGTMRGMAQAARATEAAQWGRDFLVSMLYDAAPGRGRGVGVTLADAIRGAAARLDAHPPEPAVEADMRAVLGEILSRIGTPEEAEPHLRRALAILRGLGPGHEERTAGVERALMTTMLDRGRIDEAEAMAERLRAERASRDPVGTPNWLRLQNILGRIQSARDEHEKAVAIFDRAIEAADVLSPRDRLVLETIRGNRALELRALGRFEEAEAAQREVVASRADALGPGHIDTLTARSNLAAILVERGKLEQARAEFEAVFNRQKVVLGPEHRRTLVTEHNLAVLDRRLGRLEDSERLGRHTLAVRRETLGPDASATLTTQVNLALTIGKLAENDTARAQDLLREAEDLLRDAVRRRARTEEQPSAMQAHARGTLASFLLSRGRYDEAAEQFATATRIADRTLSEARAEPWLYRAGAAAARAARGEREEAMPILERCVAALKERLPESRPSLNAVLAWRAALAGR